MMRGSRTLRSLFAIAIALAATFTAAGAQTTITLGQAIDIALESNRDLQATRLSLVRADAQVDEAFGNALPKLDFNTRYTYNIKRPVFFFPGDNGEVRPIEIGSKNALSANLSLQQIIFNSAVLTGVGTAKIYAGISRQSLRAQTADVVLNVKRAYYGALLASEALEVNRALLANAEANFRDTRALYEAGLRSEFDALTAEVRVANQRPIVVESENSVQTALDAMRLVMGSNAAPQMTADETLSLPTDLDQRIPSPEEAERLMLQNNAQIAALRLAGDVNRELIAIERSDYLPTVALFATYQYEGQADNLGDLDFQPSAFAGLNLSLNLFSGWQTDSKVQQAQIEYDQSRYQLAQLESALKTQLDGTLRRIEYARRRIEASERTIQQASRAYDIATVAYKAGTGTQLQIGDADIALTQARLNRLSAVYDLNVALAELESLLGVNYQLDGDNVRYLGGS